MHGPIPVALQVITGAALAYVIVRRGRRWRTLWVPLAAAVGAATGSVAHECYSNLGLASEPPPWRMWGWVCLVGVATAAAVFGWRGAGWWRRNAAAFAWSFCLLCTGLTINGWLGYFPTVSSAWGQLTGGRLPDQTDLQTVRAFKAKGVAPQRGAVLAVDTGTGGSGFRHRTEWVYLPPAWFAAAPPRLPAIAMIGGEFNTPADWIRAGDAVYTLDAFASAHAGRAPAVVFADPSGGFAVDTECVNGSRGNAADHVTDDVVPAVQRAFDVGGQGKWGVVGFSSGGTCAVDFAVMHPELFSAFVDIGGDLGPNAGTREQTIDRLFGGDAEQWSRFDPGTAIARHGPYADLSGLFAVSRAGKKAGVGQAAAESLCALGAARGIDCDIVEYPQRQRHSRRHCRGSWTGSTASRRGSRQRVLSSARSWWD
ncbi:alpha/beta hydrolase-fold protein [Mycobacterium sp. Marseille-P9652]|uniref:alpha/beta hydrolase-fold protein n=1 Tax=Mycobacterium sp. Marseille-P9652 TaxID=2654950 RepID=UPI0012E7694A|nr:alpha/beta hydrolase-fold protein [Mycobacterium sp. Marseille-P9652]